MIYLIGGAWCSSIQECKNRKNTHLGSSKPHPDWVDSNFPFIGILDYDKIQNPDFHDWNKVVVRYCDGSSFTGDVESVDPTTGLHFRGRRIFDAIMDELFINKGMKHAKHVFLTGGSAGGLSAIIHCDRFSKRFPKANTVKCLSDGGFFLHSQDPAQAHVMESMFRGVVDLHNSTGILPEACKNRMKDNKELCMFPQYILKDIQTPLLIMNSPYDSYQMNMTLSRSTKLYQAVKSHHISPAQYETLKVFRFEMLQALCKTDTPSRGLCINNCFLHTQLTTAWNKTGFEVNHKKNVKVVGDRYFQRRRRVKEVDQNTLVKDCEHDTYIQEGT